MSRLLGITYEMSATEESEDRCRTSIRGACNGAPIVDSCSPAVPECQEEVAPLAPLPRKGRRSVFVA